MEQKTRKEQKKTTQSFEANTESNQGQKTEKSHYSENPEYVDSILGNIQFDKEDTSEIHTEANGGFLLRSAKNQKPKGGKFPLAAAIHLGFLLIAIGVAFMAENASASQLFTAVSIIFAAMAIRFLDNQNNYKNE